MVLGTQRVESRFAIRRLCTCAPIEIGFAVQRSAGAQSRWRSPARGLKPTAIDFREFLTGKMFVHLNRVAVLIIVEN